MISDTTQILYDEACSWEYSFITQEFFDELPNIKTFNKNNINDITFTDNCKNKILVFGSNLLSYEEVLSICERTNPTIIIHCSDEWGNRPQFDFLVEKCNLYLRQYRHTSYKSNEKIKVIPLGYGVDLLKTSWSKEEIIPSNERSYMWSFIGNIKSDRQEMLKQFSKLENGFFGTADKQTMKKVYSQSKFVPIGRGNITLNCLRIYEAVTCGAIPVIVGNKDEIENTFKDEDTSAWIISKSWQGAVIDCISLSSDSNKINSKQKILINYWENRLKDIKDTINKHMEI